MKSASWKSIAEFTGITAIVASLIFVGLELRQSQKIAYDAAAKAEGELIIGVQAIVSQNPDIWLRGCRGEELNDVEHLLFTQVFHAFDTLYFFRYVSTSTGVGSATVVASVHTMALNIHRNPGFRKTWEARHEWRPRDTASSNLLIRYRDLVNARVTELAKLEPDPLRNTGRCGRS